MSDFITALTGTNGISANTFWSALTDAAPFIVIVFGIAVGYRIVRKALKGGSKAKVNM